MCRRSSPGAAGASSRSSSCSFMLNLPGKARTPGAGAPLSNEALARAALFGAFRAAFHPAAGNAFGAAARCAFFHTAAGGALFRTAARRAFRLLAFLLPIGHVVLLSGAVTPLFRAEATLKPPARWVMP